MKFELEESLRGAPGGELLEDLRRSAKAIGSRGIRIEADGGTTPETAGLVAGSAIFKGGPEHYAANIAAIRQVAARKRRRDAA